MHNRTPSALAERSLAELVTEDSRAARVFEEFGLDFCCHGRRSVLEAARARGVPLASVTHALAALGTPTSEDVEPASWQDPRALIRHILDRHHAYVRSAAPAISSWLNRLADRHGARHPQLVEIRQTFQALADELRAHMLKEENILFPHIADLAAAQAREADRPLDPFGTVLNPIRVMEADHALAGELAERLRTLTGGFTPPADGCTTFRLCYAELHAFTQDLHRHIHLENNLLFPRAAELEQRLG